MELVNHMPPGVADKLIGRLRASEMARQAAEERAAAASAAAAGQAAEALSPEAEGRCAHSDEARFRRSWLRPVALTAAAAALAAAMAAAAHLGFETPALLSQCAATAAAAVLAAATAEPLHSMKHAETFSSVAAVADSHPLCEEALQELGNTTNALRRHRAIISTNYLKVIEAAGPWMRFALDHRAAADTKARSADPTPRGNDGEGEQEDCWEAAGPAREALKALAALAPAA